jgi:hypothetical protein
MRERAHVGGMKAFRLPGLLATLGLAATVSNAAVARNGSASRRARNVDKASKTRADDSASGSSNPTLPNEPRAAKKPSSAHKVPSTESPSNPSAGVQAMIAIPASPKVSAATWPRQDVPDYAFVVRSYGGPELGTGLHENDWTLQVEARSALVSLEYSRSDADIPGETIGLFRYRIDDHALRDFYSVVTTSKLFASLPATAEHRVYSQSRYTLIEATKDPRQETINNGDEESHVLIAPVLAKTRAMFSNSFDHPERAVILGLERTRVQGGEAFLVSIKNVGVDRVCLTDPRWIVANGPLDRSVVMITEYPGERPGQSPRLDWKELPLEPLPHRPSQEALISLEPGETWRARSAVWKRVPGKEYLAQFTWARYPGEPLVNGVYRIRGRVDSERLSIEP